MDGPEAPVFVFEDDLGVFASIGDAEMYYEPWIEDWVKAIYDRHGNVFQLAAFNRRRGGVTITPVNPPLNRRDEFVERLRHYLDGVSEHRPDLLQREWVARATADDLIRWCLDFYLKPKLADRKRPWWRFW